MDFDVESLSTQVCQLDGLPRILRTIVFLERRKLALRNRLYPSSNHDKDMKFRFLDLPIEIQILIIREYIQYWPLVGQTPDLIKALRPQPGSYQQALAVFYSSRTVTISANNERRVLEMPKSILRKAVSVDIWYGYVRSLEPQMIASLMVAETNSVKIAGHSSSPGLVERCQLFSTPTFALSLFYPSSETKVSCSIRSSL
jgi:hypothetical protein